MLSIQASFRSVVKHAKRAKTVRGNEPYKIGGARFRRSDLHVKHMETARQKKMLTIKERLYLGKIKKEQETAQKAGRGKRERR